MEGGADAAGQVQVLALDGKAGGEGFPQALEPGLGPGRVGDAGEHQGEAVGGGPGDEVVLADEGREAPGHGPQHPVGQDHAHAVHDLAEAVDVHQQQEKGGLFGGAAVFQVFQQEIHIGDAGQGVEAQQVFQAGLGLAQGGPVAGLPDLPLHHRSQAAQVVLADEVPGAAAHGLDGDVVGDHAGDDDEGQVAPPGLQQGQGRDRVELGHVVVADDHVPAALGQLLLHGGAGLHPCPLDAVAALAQGTGGQLHIQFGVVDEEDAQGQCRLRRYGHGVWRRCMTGVGRL